MLRTPITLTAAALAAALALSACGSVRLGAAAVTNTSPDSHGDRERRGEQP